MATQISICISSEYGSTFNSDFSPNGILAVKVSTYIWSGYNNADGTPASHPYEKVSINFHGSHADLRSLAEKIIAAIEPTPEPECECTTINEDTVDASNCAVHNSRGALDKAISENHERNAGGCRAEPLRSLVNAISDQPCGSLESDDVCF